MGSGQNGNPEAIELMSVPPQNIDAEQAVLGALMQAGDNDDVFFEIQSDLSPNSFYRQAHRDIFSACAAIASRQEPIDLVSVTSELEKKAPLDSIGMGKYSGVAYLNELIESCPSVANIKHYAMLVRDAAIRRYLIRQCAMIAEMADDQSIDIDEVVEKTEAAIMMIRENKSQDHLVHIKTSVTDTLKRIQTLYENDESIIGLPTGFHKLDIKTSGMQPGQYIVIAGRPGMGKSTLIQNIIKNVAVDRGKAAVLFSVETSSEAFTMRLLSQVSGENFQALRTGHISDWSRLVAATGELAGSPVWIDSTGGIKPSEMRGKLRQIQRKDDIGLILVDYIQLMNSDGRQEGRRLEMESISLAMKSLAQEFRCPILVCSQLSRKCEERPDKRPLLSDLRETGAIEQDADIVLAVYRDGVYDNKIDPKNTELIILKHRDGPTGKIYMKFDMGVMTFSEVG